MVCMLIMSKNNGTKFKGQTFFYCIKQSVCSCSVCDRHRNKANKQKILLSRQTHVSKGVQVVVGEFEFLERDKLAAPVRPCGGRVRMDVEPTGHRGLCLPRHRPL